MTVSIGEVTRITSSRSIVRYIKDCRAIYRLNYLLEGERHSTYEQPSGAKLVRRAANRVEVSTVHFCWIKVKTAGRCVWNWISSFDFGEVIINIMVAVLFLIAATMLVGLVWVWFTLEVV